MLTDELRFIKKTHIEQSEFELMSCLRMFALVVVAIELIFVFYIVGCYLQS